MRSKTREYKAAYWKKWRMENLPYVQRICSTCKKKFNPHGTQKRCDECRTKTCPGCKIRFIPEYGQHKQVCCSQKCAARIDPACTARIFAHRGTKPRTYAVRDRDKHGSAEDRDWRTAIFNRDGFRCRGCGAKGRLQAHHIKPYKAYPELRHVLSNGLTLCIPCHKKTDTYGWANYWKSQIAAKRLAQSSMFEQQQEGEVILPKAYIAPPKKPKMTDFIQSQINEGKSIDEAMQLWRAL